MNYSYESNIRPIDFWKLSMYRTYHSLVGVCNLIFGAAMIGLTVRFWDTANDVVQAVLFLACLLIPVIQPLGVYLKAKVQVSLIPQGAELSFAEDGIHVSLSGKRELIRWHRVRQVVKTGRNGDRVYRSEPRIYADQSGFGQKKRRVLSICKGAYQYFRDELFLAAMM